MSPEKTYVLFELSNAPLFPRFENGSPVKNKLVGKIARDLATFFTPPGPE